MFDEDKFWNKAYELVPAGTQTFSKCPNQFVDGFCPKFALNAVGSKIQLSDGNWYFDLMCGLGPIILGYKHERTNAAIRRQLESGIIFSLPSKLECELAELIIDCVPCAEMVKFAKNGSDVTTAAVRASRGFTKKEHVARCGYNGWHDWSAAGYRPYGIPESFSEYIHDFEYNDLDSLESVLRNHDCASIIMEPQALTRPVDGFLEGVRELADKYESVLIFDEVVTGFRWSLGGAQKYFNVTPDLATFGKCMANGMPISVVTGKKEIMNELVDVAFSSTFGGECLSLAAAIETIKELRAKDYSQIWDMGNLFENFIYDAASQFDLDIDFQGSAPRHHLEFNDSYNDSVGMKSLFYQEMFRRRVLFSNVLYTVFSHTKKDYKYVRDMAFEAFDVVKKNIDNIDKALEGKRIGTIFRRNV